MVRRRFFVRRGIFFTVYYVKRRGRIIRIVDVVRISIRGYSGKERRRNVFE